MADLAVLYEHPQWFEPLFAELDRRGIEWVRLAIQDHVFDPADRTAPAPVVFNRLAMSSFLRQSEHALFYGLAVLDHWQGLGARVVNGPAPLSIDLSKARQLSLFRRLGLATPATRVAHRQADIPRLADEVGYPVMIKANIGGSGAGIIRYDDPDFLAEAAADGLCPMGVDGVALVQAYVPARDGRIIRCETLAGRFLYAIALEGAGASFDLCPADVCLADKPQITVTAYDPPPAIIAAVEAIARAAQLDVGGVEYMIDESTGEALFYDYNALSNFVARPREVLGFDPHEALVDFLEREIAVARAPRLARAGA